MRRSKENIEYWHNRTTALFVKAPKFKEVEHRYDALTYLLQQKYPLVKGNRELYARLLKDAIYLDRHIRKVTEGEQEETKRELSRAKKEELGYV